MVNSRKWVHLHPRYNWQYSLNRWLIAHDAKRTAEIAAAEAENIAAMDELYQLAQNGGDTSWAQVRCSIAMRRLLDA